MRERALTRYHGNSGRARKGTWKAYISRYVADSNFRTQGAQGLVAFLMGLQRQLPQCRALGKDPTPGMPVGCERFQVVYP
jgi:hypothetical protein